MLGKKNGSTVAPVRFRRHIIAIVAEFRSPGGPECQFPGTKSYGGETFTRPKMICLIRGGHSFVRCARKSASADPSVIARVFGFRPDTIESRCTDSGGSDETNKRVKMRIHREDSDCSTPAIIATDSCVQASDRRNASTSQSPASLAHRGQHL